MASLEKAQSAFSLCFPAKGILDNTIHFLGLGSTQSPLKSATLEKLLHAKTNSEIRLICHFFNRALWKSYQAIEASRWQNMPSENHLHIIYTKRPITITALPYFFGHTPSKSQFCHWIEQELGVKQVKLLSQARHIPHNTINNLGSITLGENGYLGHYILTANANLILEFSCEDIHQYLPGTKFFDRCQEMIQTCFPADIQSALKIKSNKTYCTLKHNSFSHLGYTTALKSRLKEKDYFQVILQKH